MAGSGNGEDIAGLTDGGVLRELKSLEEEEWVGELAEGWSRARTAMKMLQSGKGQGIILARCTWAKMC